MVDRFADERRLARASIQNLVHYVTAAGETAYTIQYGTTQIHYSLRSTRRKTLGTTMRPDYIVTVAAPFYSAPELSAEKVKQPSAWIVKRQRKFERYLPHLPANTSAVRSISSWVSSTGSKSSKRTQSP